MTTHDRFEKVNDEYLKFYRMKHTRNHRADLNAFLLLDELFPGKDCDMIISAEHDEIWLDVDSDKLETLTDDHILELVRCGVRYDENYDRLCMFV